MSLHTTITEERTSPGRPAKRKHARKTHSKSRNGCITCKIRRKKCDEAWPTCARCISDGRKCDGYASLPGKVLDLTKLNSQDGHTGFQSPTSISATSESSGSSRDLAITGSNSSSPLCPPVNLSIFSNEKEYFSFSRFFFHISPSFSGYFDSTFWQGYLLRRCFENATVRQAAIAFGAFHQYKELSSTTTLSTGTEFAIQAYNKALKLVQIEIGENASLETLTAVSILFSSIETSRGNIETAINHFSSGLRAAFSKGSHKVPLMPQSPPRVATESALRAFLKRLKWMAMDILGRPPLLAFDIAPTNFQSVNDAYDSLLAQVQLLLDALDRGNLHMEIQHYVDRLVQWSTVHAEFSIRMDRLEPQDQRCLRVLRLCREAVYLLLLTYINNHTGQDLVHHGMSADMRSNILNAYFAKLILLADNVDANPTYLTHISPGKLHRFGIDSGLINYQPSGFSKVNSSYFEEAEAMGTVEEEAVLRCGLVPPEAICMDVASILNEGKVSIRYCITDSTFSNQWTQEWATF